MQVYYRYLMIILSAALVWAQSAVAVHETLHLFDTSHHQKKSVIYEAIYNHDFIHDHHVPHHHDASHNHDSSHNHDKSHNPGSDDCVTCKIFKKGNDNLHDVTIVSFFQITKDSKVHIFSNGHSLSELRARPSSRAPPLF